MDAYISPIRSWAQAAASALVDGACREPTGLVGALRSFGRLSNLGGLSVSALVDRLELPGRQRDTVPWKKR